MKVMWSKIIDVVVNRLLDIIYENKILSMLIVTLIGCFIIITNAVITGQYPNGFQWETSIISCALILLITAIEEDKSQDNKEDQHQ